MNIHGVTEKKKDHDGAIVVLFGMGASYLRLPAAQRAPQAPTTSAAGVGGFFLIIFQYGLCILYTILDGLQPYRSVIATPQKIEG
jgi:hypothetical protein